MTTLWERRGLERPRMTRGRFTSAGHLPTEVRPPTHRHGRLLKASDIAGEDLAFVLAAASALPDMCGSICVPE